MLPLRFMQFPGPTLPGVTFPGSEPTLYTKSPLSPGPGLGPVHSKGRAAASCDAA